MKRCGHDEAGLRASERCCPMVAMVVGAQRQRVAPCSTSLGVARHQLLCSCSVQPMTQHHAGSSEPHCGTPSGLHPSSASTVAYTAPVLGADHPSCAVACGCTHGQPAVGSGGEGGGRGRDGDGEGGSSRTASVATTAQGIVLQPGTTVASSMTSSHCREAAESSRARTAVLPSVIASSCSCHGSGSCSCKGSSASKFAAAPSACRRHTTRCPGMPPSPLPSPCPASLLLLLLLLLVPYPPPRAPSSTTSSTLSRTVRRHAPYGGLMMAAAINLRESFDASLDWAANVTAKGPNGCTLPKKVAPPGQLPPRCPVPRKRVGLEEARRLGWRFAPIVHQHALDWTRLSDPAAWMAGATIVDPLTFATTDLHTHLENRHRARRAKLEAAIAAAAAAAPRGGSSADAATAAAAAAAALEKVVAADPYWLTHESFDTHNFYATRLVRRKRRTEQQGDGTDAPGEEAGVRGNAGEAKGRGAAEEQAAGDKGGGANSEPNALGGLRRSMGEQQQQQQQDAGGRRGRAGKEEQERHGHGQRHGGGRAGGNGTAAGEAPPPPEEPQEDPRFPKFEVFQGEEFMQAIAGDPLEAPGQLAGTVYYTVFQPHLSHLRWRSGAHPRQPSAAKGATSTSSDEGGGGDGSDPDPESDGPSYAYVYTYWLFYPFNGCSNQLMATRFAGRHQGAEYFICPLGVHEGDWEHLKVYVCEDGMAGEDPSTAVAALQYSQHTWLPTYDCTSGECTFEEDGEGLRRPRVIAGLHSHANSPHESNLNVYAKINFKQLLNFDGIYVADRFSAKGGPVFRPTPNNTLWLPFEHEMHERDKEPGGKFAWATYKGNWGVPLSSPSFSLTCLRDNLTATGPCDTRNPPIFILDRLLGGVEDSPANITWTAVLNPKRVAPEISEGITGPLVRRAAASTWERELAAPLWDDHEPLPGLGISLAALTRDTSSLACPLTEDAHRTSTAASSSSGALWRQPTSGRLRLFVIGATVAALLATVVSALVVKCMPLLLAPHHEKARGAGYQGVLAAPLTYGVVYGKYDGDSYGGASVGGDSIAGAGAGGEAVTEPPQQQRHGGKRGRAGTTGPGGAVRYDSSTYSSELESFSSAGESSSYSDGEDLTELLQQEEGLAAKGRREGSSSGTGAVGGQRAGAAPAGGSRRTSLSGRRPSAATGGAEGAAAAVGTTPGGGRGRLQTVQMAEVAGAGGGAGGGGSRGVAAGGSRKALHRPPRSSDSVGGDGGVLGNGLAAAAALPALEDKDSGSDDADGDGGGGDAGERQPLLMQSAPAAGWPGVAGSGGSAVLAARGGGGGGGRSGGAVVAADEDGGSAAGDHDDDDDDGVSVRGKLRGGGLKTYGRRGWSCLRCACPAGALLPLLAWRACLATCRAVCGCVTCAWCRGSRAAPARRAGEGGGGDQEAAAAAAAGRRRKRRGLGPYLLGCATQPERRMLWLSLGTMSYSLGLVLSAQGLLETLHALRNLLLRGLVAIAGLEGLFVGLLAAFGLAELGLMVAAVALGPKIPETRPRREAHHASAAAAHPLAPTAAPTAGVVPSAPGESPFSAKDAALPLRDTPSTQGAAFATAAGPTARDTSAHGTAAAAGGSAHTPLLVSGSGLSLSSIRALQAPFTDPHFPAAAAAAAAATASATATAASAAASAAASTMAAVPWRTLALLAAVAYMEVATALHVLGFALALWVGVLGASEGCSAAVQGLYRVISFSPDVCLDLSVIGVPGPRCGGDLLHYCNVWRQLHLSGLLYGSILIIAARLLLLVMATANYHSRHAVMLPVPTHHHGHGHHHRSVHHSHQHGHVTHGSSGMWRGNAGRVHGDEGVLLGAVGKAGEGRRGSGGGWKGSADGGEEGAGGVEPTRRRRRRQQQEQQPQDRQQLGSPRAHKEGQVGATGGGVSSSVSGGASGGAGVVGGAVVAPSPKAGAVGGLPLSSGVSATGGAGTTGRRGAGAAGGGVGSGGHPMPPLPVSVPGSGSAAGVGTGPGGSVVVEMGPVGAGGGAAGGGGAGGGKSTSSSGWRFGF